MADSKHQEDGMDIWDKLLLAGTAGLYARGAYKGVKRINRLRKPGRIPRPIAGSGLIEGAAGLGLNEVRMARRKK